MFRLLLFFGLFTLLVSCENAFLIGSSTLIEPSISVSEYYLAYDIIPYNYSNPENQNAIAVYAEQDMDFTFSFKDLNTLDRYLFFVYGLDLAPDSIAILGNLRFVQESISFEHEMMDLEFILIERLENLMLNPDSSYSYISNEILYQRLTALSWGNVTNTVNTSPSQMLITFPFSVEDETLPHSLLTSNIFYFPHEDLTLSSINYIEEKDAVEIMGNFTVDLKMPSCGFYSTHLVNNAEFTALIK